MRDNTGLIGGLVRLLAGQFVLSCKTRYFSWCFGGNQRSSATRLLREDCRHMAELTDLTALQIASEGGTVPGPYTALLPMSSVQESQEVELGAMMKMVNADHLQMIADSEFVSTLLNESSDPGTEKAVTEMISRHRSCADQYAVLLLSKTGTIH